MDDTFNFDPFQTSYGFEVPSDLVPEHAVSNRPPLGMLLLKQGVLSEEQLEQILRLQFEQQVPLVQLLLEGGYATQEQVLAALQQRPHLG